MALSKYVVYAVNMSMGSEKIVGQVQPHLHQLNLGYYHSLTNSSPPVDKKLPTNPPIFLTENININFLRKERLYTKLKYSRSPAYDIVSGGSAAILAGFLGFLISEKFGFELVDSGDFYYLFMYIVFACFFFRPLLTTTSYNMSLFEVFSIKPLVKYIIELLIISKRFLM
jgi:hypothetical protein